MLQPSGAIIRYRTTQTQWLKLWQLQRGCEDDPCLPLGSWTLDMCCKRPHRSSYAMFTQTWLLECIPSWTFPWLVLEWDEKPYKVCWITIWLLLMNFELEWMNERQIPSPKINWDILCFKNALSNFNSSNASSQQYVK